MPPARDVMAHRGDDDGRFTAQGPVEGPLTVSRGLPCLQILSLLEPGYAIPYQPRMLSQDV